MNYHWILLFVTTSLINDFSIIMSVRETCADWQRGMEPAQDPALKGKKDPDNGFVLKVPRRNVGMESFLMFVLYIVIIFIFECYFNF